MGSLSLKCFRMRRTPNTEGGNLVYPGPTFIGKAAEILCGQAVDISSHSSNRFRRQNDHSRREAVRVGTSRLEKIDIGK